MLLADTEGESLLIWKTLKICQTQCLDIIVLRIYFSICVDVSHKRDRGCLLKLDIKSMRACYSCSGVVENFQGLCTVEMNQLVQLIGDCVLAVSSKLSGMSLV